MPLITPTFMTKPTSPSHLTPSVALLKNTLPADRFVRFGHTASPDPINPIALVYMMGDGQLPSFTEADWFNTLKGVDLLQGNPVTDGSISEMRITVDGQPGPTAHTILELVALRAAADKNIALERALYRKVQEALTPHLIPKTDMTVDEAARILNWGQTLGRIPFNPAMAPQTKAHCFILDSLLGYLNVNQPRHQLFGDGLIHGLTQTPLPSKAVIQRLKAQVGGSRDLAVQFQRVHRANVFFRAFSQRTTFPAELTKLAQQSGKAHGRRALIQELLNKPMLATVENTNPVMELVTDLLDPRHWSNETMGGIACRALTQNPGLYQATGRFQRRIEYLGSTQVPLFTRNTLAHFLTLTLNPETAPNWILALLTQIANQPGARTALTGAAAVQGGFVGGPNETRLASHPRLQPLMRALQEAGYNPPHLNA